MNGDTPWQLELKPAEWQAYLKNAITALHENPRDQEALEAVRHANEALSVYDEGEAATPGERIEAGLSAAPMGLLKAAVDIPAGLVNTIAHPIQTVKNLPKVPGQLASELSSDDPEEVVRGVGNVGSFLLPFAKSSRAGSFRLGAPPEGPTVAAVASRVAGRGLSMPFRSMRAADALLDRAPLTNELLKMRIAELARRNTARGPEVPRLPGLQTTGEDIGASQQVDLKPSAPKPPDPMERPTYLRRQEAKAATTEEAPRAPEPSGPTPEELAVAKKLGIPVEQVRGRVGVDALKRARQVETSPQVSSVGDRPTRSGGGPVNDRGQPLFRGARKAFAKGEPDPLREALVDQVAGGRAASDETMARVQKGATKGQLKFRGEQIKTPEQVRGADNEELRQWLEGASDGSHLRKMVERELQRRGHGA